MDVVIRALLVYGFLLLLFRIMGKRTLGQVTMFDFVLLLVIGEATQEALMGEDSSFTASALVITTLVTTDVGLAYLQQHSRTVDRLIEGLPLILINNGELLRDRMDKSLISEEDIRASARSTQGLERLDQVKYAVLERNGQISIIPKSSS